MVKNKKQQHYLSKSHVSYKNLNGHQSVRGLKTVFRSRSRYDWLYQSWYKNMVWQLTFDVISSPLFSALVIPRVIRILVFWMKLGAQFVENPCSTSTIYNCILTFSFCLISLIIPKFHNHVFYIDFVTNKDILILT